jgi:hypothetical protein
LINSISNNEKIILTPNSINGNIKTSDENFTFGSNVGFPYSYTQSNYAPIDFSFDDESMAYSQFEIKFNKQRGKFYVIDNKKGTGIFARINKKFHIDRDVIISFCSCHMILQVTADRKMYI